MFGQRKVKIPFGERYRTSKLILRESLRLVLTERRFWIFPLAAVLIMLLNLALGAWLVFTYMDTELFGSQWTMLLLLPLMYPSMLAVSLAQSALAYGYYLRLSGQRCTPGKAFARAMSRLPTLAMFNVISMLIGGILSFVGILLDKLRLVPYLGQVANTAGGLAWTVASFFVIPVIVVQRDVTTGGALRESVALARQQWGKSVAGVVTIMLAVTVPMIILATAFFGAMMLAAFFALDLLMETPILFALPLIVFIPAMLFFAIVAMTAMPAYQTALYRFARTGLISKPFTQSTLVDAWAPYQQR